MSETYEQEIARTKKMLLGLKPGDKIWVGVERYPTNWVVKTVGRVTNTQIVVEPLEGPGSYHNRYYRDGGYQVGGSRFMTERIHKLATGADVMKFEQAQKNKKAAEDRQYSERERVKHASDELNGILGDGKYVRHADRESADGDVWSLTIDGLSTEKVKQLAVFLQEVL